MDWQDGLKGCIILFHPLASIFCSTKSRVVNQWVKDLTLQVLEWVNGCGRLHDRKITSIDRVACVKNKSRDSLNTGNSVHTVSRERHPHAFKHLCQSSKASRSLNRSSLWVFSCSSIVCFFMMRLLTEESNSETVCGFYLTPDLFVTELNYMTRSHTAWSFTHHCHFCAIETTFDGSEVVIISALHKSAMLPLSGLRRNADTS